jgi:hypothetical protein
MIAIMVTVIAIGYLLNKCISDQAEIAYCKL